MGKMRNIAIDVENKERSVPDEKLWATESLIHEVDPLIRSEVDGDPIQEILRADELINSR